MTWFRVEAALRDHDLLGVLSESLRVPVAEAAGLYVLTLAGFAEHQPSGRPELVTDTMLEDWAKWRGKRGRFAQLFRDRLVETREGQRDPPGQIKGWWRQAALFRKQQNDAEKPAGNKNPQTTDPESPDFPATFPRGKSAGSSRYVYVDGNNKEDIRLERRSNGRHSRGRPTWMTPYATLWTAGEPPYGQIAKYIKPLHDQHGETEVTRRLLNYLQSTEMTFWSMARFAQTWNNWDHAPVPKGITDEPVFDWAN